MTTLTEYTDWTRTTAVYPGADTGDDREIAYLSMGLAAETGELLNVLKKSIRDSVYPDPDVVASELGDVLWYWARLCVAHYLEPEEIMSRNMRKLESRKARGVIGGAGDNR